MWGFGEQDQGSSATCIISKLYYQHEVYIKFLYYKITPFHPSHTVFFRRKSLCTADTWVKSYSAPWKWIIYINYLEFFCMGDVSLFPSIFIHLCIYIYISIDTLLIFTLYCGLKSNTLCFFVKLILLFPLETLLVSFCVPLTYPQQHGSVVFKHLLLGTEKCSQLIMHIFCPGLVYWKMVFEIKVWV